MRRVLLNVGTDRLLPDELASIQPARPQPIPKRRFGSGLPPFGSAVRWKLRFCLYSASPIASKLNAVCADFSQD